MLHKKVIAVVLCFLIAFSLNSCKENEDVSATQESTTEFSNNTNINETVAENVFNTEAAILNTTSEHTTQTVTSPSSTEGATVSTEADTQAPSAQPQITTTENYDDPANWSKSKIVEEYKKAATKTHSTAKSTQSITLKEIHINNGEYDSAISLVKPIISKFIESKSTENDGITGGFQHLAPGDASSAKAYKNSDGLVIEMVMVEQTSGAKEDANSGSVGHAISTVGDISSVTKDLEDMGLPLEISEEDTKIYYTNPVVKVVINDDGKIISGTWSYTVEISMNNLKAFGKTVDNASIIMENTITL